MLKKASDGFSIIETLIILLVVSVIGIGGWYVWDNSRTEEKKTDDERTTQTSNGEDKNQSSMDETSDWIAVTTQGGAFSMKIPDGWHITNYPNNFLGGIEILYTPGTPAIIDNSGEGYMGHSLRFRASVTELDDAGLGPQWASPQPGLEESSQVFSIGSLQGKRFKGTFSQDLNQTLYEYVFDIGDNQKLDIVYTIYHNEGEKDDVATVEKAIKTIKLNDN